MWQESNDDQAVCGIAADRAMAIFGIQVRDDTANVCIRSTFVEAKREEILWKRAWIGCGQTATIMCVATGK